MRTFYKKILISCATIGLATVTAQSYAHEQHADQNKIMHATPNNCPKLSKDMRSWQQPIVMSSAQSGTELSQSTISINQAVQASLFPTRSVKFIVAPEERGGSVSFAGMVQFDVPTQSTYRVITNGRPWVEMVKNGKTIESVKHQHGAKCLEMEKMLDFPLSPGRHILEFTANGKNTIKFMVLPVPK